MPYCHLHPSDAQIGVADGQRPGPGGPVACLRVDLPVSMRAPHGERRRLIRE